MENQKVYSALIICLIIIFCPFALYSQEYNQLHIGAEVNGDLVYDKVVVHDKDTCSFYLMDKNGRKQTSLSGDISLGWYLSFPTRKGELWYKKINIDKCEHSVGLRITSEDFHNRFTNDKAKNERGICYTDGEIKCYMWKGNSLSNIYSMSVLFDVLPSEPQIKILDTYLEEDNGYLWPVAVAEVTTENFDYGLIYLSDSPLFSGEFFMQSDPVPYRVNLYLTYESKCKCDVFNGYGVCGSEEVYPDWSQTSVANIKKDNISVFSGKGFCKIISERPMKNICIYDINGRIIFDTKSISQVDIPLNNGIYILQIIDNEGVVTRKKILIK